MLQYFLFAGSKSFFINIRENANIDFAPIFGSLFLFSAARIRVRKCLYQREYVQKNV